MRLMLLVTALIIQLGFISDSMAAVKVMIVGDSLTEFQAYRAQFAARAKADKADIEFVGPKSDATGAHAGFSGRAIGAFNYAKETSQINGQTVNTSMAAMLEAHQPDVVLLMIGTNDMNHGLGMKQPTRYPTSSESGFAIAAEYAEPVKGSYLNGIGTHFQRPDFGSALKKDVESLVNTVLDSSPTRKLIMAKIPPVGVGGEGSAADPYAPGNPTRTLKEFNDNAVERIKEYNSYIDQVHKALPAAKRARMHVVDNFKGVDRSQQTGSMPTDFGPASRQLGDWVHPQQNAAAWTLMGDNFYNAYKKAVAKR